MTADELERERIRRRLGDFQRAPDRRTVKVSRPGVIAALRRFGWNYEAIGLVLGLTVLPAPKVDEVAVPLRRTPRRPAASELEAS